MGFIKEASAKMHSTFKIHYPLPLTNMDMDGTPCSQSKNRTTCSFWGYAYAIHFQVKWVRVSHVLLWSSWHLIRRRTKEKRQTAPVTVRSVHLVD